MQFFLFSTLSLYLQTHWYSFGFYLLEAMVRILTWLKRVNKARNLKLLFANLSLILFTLLYTRTHIHKQAHIHTHTHTKTHTHTHTHTQKKVLSLTSLILCINLIVPLTNAGLTSTAYMETKEPENRDSFFRISIPLNIYKQLYLKI